MIIVTMEKYSLKTLKGHWINDATLDPFRICENILKGVYACCNGAIGGEHNPTDENKPSIEELKEEVDDIVAMHNLNILWDDEIKLSDKSDTIVLQYWIYQYPYQLDLLKYAAILPAISFAREYIYSTLRGYSAPEIQRIWEVTQEERQEGEPSLYHAMRRWYPIRE